MKKGTFIFSTFMFSLFIFLCCCNTKELSRSLAQSLIEQSTEYKQPFALELMQGETLLPYGKTLYVLDSGEETPDQAAARKIKEYYEKNPQIAVANHLGLVEARVRPLDPAQPKQQNSLQKPIWSFEEDYLATDKAKALWKEYGFPPTEKSVPLAGKKITGITGITKQGEEQATAQFKWQYAPNEAGRAFDVSTPEFKALPSNLQRLLDGTLPPSELVSKRENKMMSFSTIRQGQAIFRRYDDGWRLESVIFQ
ncbi:MAG TPA: hypothetical protein VGB00_01905 [Pyrinomonadaceae bacterium]|jgi:hypothetical protein